MSQGHLAWGILGTGNIARQFAAGVRGAQQSKVVAVGSRSLESAQQFAQAQQAGRAWGSYQELLDDPLVQAVYISLPNSLHHQWTLRALSAGKHVLCEKPLACNMPEAREMFAAAEKAGRLLVEAYMYRSHPQTRLVLDLVRQGAIGQLKLIRTSFCYRNSNTGNIRFQSELAGGALMDVGCYCVDLACQLAGSIPQAVHVTAQLHPLGVDEYAVGTLRFPEGILSSFVCGMTVQSDNSALICGEEGYIAIPVPWKPPVENAQFELVRMTPPIQDKNRQPGPQRELRTVSADRPLYALEADEFAAAVFQGGPPAVTAEESLRNMAILDELRRQAGLKY